MTNKRKDATVVQVLQSQRFVSQLYMSKDKLTRLSCLNTQVGGRIVTIDHKKFWRKGD